MIDPYINIQVLGAPGTGNEGQDEEAAKKFHLWLIDQGFSIWLGHITGFKAFKHRIPELNVGWFRGMDSESPMNFHPSSVWRLSGYNISNHALYSWNNWSQRTFNGGARALDIDREGKPQKISLTDYNPLAEDAKNLALLVHQKLGAKLSWVDYSVRLPRPYPKSMPFWIGWCTIVGKEVADKHKLAEKLSELPGSIKLERQGTNLIFTSTQPYSEYVLNGWGEEAKAFWEKTGGKLLLPKGKKHSRSSRKKDGETYIVAQDDKGNAVLNPFKLPGV